MKWLKLLFSSKAKLIREMDKLEPILAEQIRAHLASVGKIDPVVLAKKLVDPIQRWACKWAKVDPKDVGLD